jgi:hypothetical protein
MANTVNLEFAGDATKLAQAGKKAEGAVKGVGDSVTSASDDFSSASKETDDYITRVGRLGAAVDGASTAIDDAGAAVQAIADIQDAARAKAARLAQATLDVAQAQEDANQAMIDGKQATLDVGQAQIDAEQANLDAATAQKEYNEAVKEHGANSEEARQAAIDLKQAQQDLKQSGADLEQAQADANQALIDGKQATLDLNEASREAKPPEIQGWADKIAMVTPLLTGLMGVMGLVTAAQWAWNAAQLASPTTWIILAVIALVAVIVLIATKTDWFQRAWKNSWKWIKDAASDVWDWLKKVPGWIGDAFSTVVKFISLPFRTAFNLIADAWNNTIGRLSWSVPNWIPGIGGNTISVPHLPKFHSGGIVPGTPGSEVLTVLQAGEEVKTRGSAGGQVLILKSDGSRMMDLLVEILAEAVGDRGGNVQTVLGGARG